MNSELDQRKGLLAMLLAAMFLVTAFSGVGFGEGSPSTRAVLNVDGGEYYEGRTRLFFRDDTGVERTAFGLDETVNVVFKLDYQWLSNEAQTGVNRFNVAMGYLF